MSDPRPIRADLPAFARSLPESQEVDALLAAFTAGNYAKVRELAARFLAGTADPELRRAILEVRRRTSPDPMSFYLFGLTLALLVFMTSWFFLHQH